MLIFARDSTILCVFGRSDFILLFCDIHFSNLCMLFRLANTSLQWWRCCAPSNFLCESFCSCSNASSSLIIFFMILSFFFRIFFLFFVLAVRTPAWVSCILRAHATIPLYFLLCFILLPSAIYMYCPLFYLCPAITTRCLGLCSGSIPCVRPTTFVKLPLIPIILWSESLPHSPLYIPTPVIHASVIVFMSV